MLTRCQVIRPRLTKLEQDSVRLRAHIGEIPVDHIAFRPQRLDTLSGQSLKDSLVLRSTKYGNSAQII